MNGEGGSVNGEGGAVAPAPESARGRGVHRLWGPAGQVGPSPSLEALNRSLDCDVRLWPQDVRGSRAWVRALEDAGVVTGEEARVLDEGLGRVGARLAGGAAEGAEEEDIHTLVERLLYDEVGEVAGKLHTGRSRNDQVATDTRLWAMDAAAVADRELRGLQEALLTQAEENLELPIPAYTHLRRAQPVRVAHWALSHFWALQRDRERLAGAARRTDELPLGSGAVAGCAYPVDRALLKELLGFRGVSRNSIDAVGDRDWVCELVFVAALSGAHLSRLAEDLILFSSEEFGFVRLPDEYTTGSSLLPHKRNPDGLELARGKAAILVGDVAASLALLKGLPSGYQKDLQEDKRLLFRALDALLAVLPATRETVARLRWDEPRLRRAAADPALRALDVADALVRSGVPFRAAHGRVRRALAALDQGEASGASPGAGGDPLWDALGGHARVPGLADSLEARAATGGTARRAVLEQLAAARAAASRPAAS